MNLGNRKATLGDKVYAQRKKLKLSQDELASRAGLKSRSSISKIEKGRPASQDTIVNLARALDVPYQYLMGWEASPEEQAEFEATVLTNDDLMELISLYIELDAEKKNAVKQMAMVLYKQLYP